MTISITVIVTVVPIVLFRFNSFHSLSFKFNFDHYVITLYNAYEYTFTTVYIKCNYGQLQTNIKKFTFNTDDEMQKLTPSKHFAPKWFNGRTTDISEPSCTPMNESELFSFSFIGIELDTNTTYLERNIAF